MIDQPTVSHFLMLAGELDNTAYHFKAVQLWMESQCAPGIAKALYREMNERWEYASRLRRYVLERAGRVETIPGIKPPNGNRGTINAELQKLLQLDESTYAIFLNTVKGIMATDPIAANFLSNLGCEYAVDINEVRVHVDHTSDNMIKNLHLALVDSALYEKYK